MDGDSTTKFVPEHRRTTFKNKSRFEADELRRRRESQQVELRKQKREETLAKRRNLDEIVSTLNDDSDEEHSDDDQYFMQSVSIQKGVASKNVGAFL